MRLSLFAGLTLVALQGFWVDPVHAADPITLSRDQYGDALIAIDRGQWTDYEQLRNDLDDYPLDVYLDYFKLTKSPASVRPADASQFMSRSADSPLPNRFLSVYLTRAGKDRRWSDFLAVKPDEPNSVTLKCYYFRALLAQGDTLAAWEGAERLWVHGESRPKECDPLFNAWLKSGELSDEAVWARMLKAFDARKKSLLTYVSRKGSDQLTPWSESLLAVYKQPDRMRKRTLPAGDSHSVDIVTHGLPHLARYNPGKALEYWRYYQTKMSFSDEQAHKIEYAIALRSLFAKTEENAVWVDAALGRLEEDKLTEIRLRWTLEESDWTTLQAIVPKLGEEKRQEAVWRYWYAVADSMQGRHDEARKQWEAIATERGYYGFLSADRLGQPYSFNNQPLVLQEAQAEPLREIPAVQRIGELYFHEEDNLAHSEWYNLLNDKSSDERQLLAALASDQGWHRMGIDAASKAKAWDALDIRFPMPYQETFAHHATLQRVPPTELMAIARRESAFFPQARSPVGARGLMQVMPATGKQVASSLGRSHSTSALYDVEHNVLLGSTYYRQLLDRFNGNRVFALTAYNAGPHRVERWRDRTDEPVPVEVWIETIPFRETRNYVQAVLSYNVVFQHLQGNDLSLLTPLELQGQY
ncbi:MAG: transglycosylase SLT domain-containing protein [Halieaceae bacterium]